MGEKEEELTFELTPRGWMPTGSHTRCPACRSHSVMARLLVTGEWEYACPDCGSTGSATPKKPEERGKWVDHWAEEEGNYGEV